MALKDDFEKAAQDVKNLPAKPSNEELLRLYSLYKQATEGDVSGSRPGMLDFKGRAKFDAWEKLKSKSKDSAMQEYIVVVGQLIQKYK